ncbi:MAG TPA: Asp-tRNA(Asn)/Glu-tRNA(Gln) amidotransferase subunit GatB [Chloroflexota bacterium]|nr:Asp-tRNA(Asn)/Glu-tRNA(Gln) amidotransferase subunit GatB [Chloroflexota bacterium]
MTGVQGQGLEPVIGLEVHAQLLTRSKMFCGCSATYSGTPPNTHVCAVCSGMPGALPVINRAAVDMAVLAALALNCRIAEQSKFDRKNYSYPDLPKGYQISQYDMPIGIEGRLNFDLAGETRSCRLVRVHLEEDTGKLIHAAESGREYSLVDYNRSGVPLIEIVSEPDLRSPEEARRFFVELRRILMFIGVNDGNLQEGSLRADVNVSVRRPDGSFGTKVEIKNLNSFRSVQRALEYEIDRQRAVLGRGELLEQETRGWLEDEEVTVSQRTKEHAHDYRYFPEPDLPPLLLTGERVSALRESLAELPADREKRFIAEYGLRPQTASLLTDDRLLADYFEEAVSAAGPVDPSRVANWVTGDVLRVLHEIDAAPGGPQLPARSVGAIVSLVERGTISGAAGKTVLETVAATHESPDEVVRRLNLAQLVDPRALEELAESVLRENPRLVQAFAKNPRVLEALVGKAISASGSKASPALLRSIMEERLQRADVR